MVLISTLISPPYSTPKLRLQGERLLFWTQIPIYPVPATFKWLWGLPRKFRITKPETKQMSLFPGLIREPIARMEDTQIVDVLDVAFLEVQCRTVRLSSEMQSI